MPISLALGNGNKYNGGENPPPFICLHRQRPNWGTSENAIPV